MHLVLMHALYNTYDALWSPVSHRQKTNHLPSFVCFFIVTIESCNLCENYIFSLVAWPHSTKQKWALGNAAIICKCTIICLYLSLNIHLSLSLYLSMHLPIFLQNYHIYSYTETQTHLELALSFCCNIAWSNSAVHDGWLCKEDDCEEVLEVWGMDRLSICFFVCLFVCFCFLLKTAINSCDFSCWK